jgi:alkanesulfonate monooxygenase SsuD/methylene tetrahydromethanopterin reductase-like flavin-dependent oxidoreductase (luciferase family)
MTLKLGFYATGSANSNYVDIIRQIEYGERVGFDSVWLRERHFHSDHNGRNFFSSPFIAASYIAAKTKQIRIGIGAKLLPLDHPVHIAENAATVDIVSNGRLDLGIARIGENEIYEKAYGVPVDESRGRFEQSYEVIIKAWTMKQFSYNGNHFDFLNLTVNPKPIQKPHPPIYLVGISRETLKFGAKRGLPLLIAGAQTVSIVRKTQDNYHKMLMDYGFDGKNIICPVNRFIYVADTNKKAIEDTKETIMNFVRRGNSAITDFLFLPREKINYDLLFNEVCIFGDPEFCLQRIESMKEEIDLRSLILTFNYYNKDHGKCMNSMQLFAKYVMPSLKNSQSRA